MLYQVGSWRRLAWDKRIPWAKLTLKYIEKVIFLINNDEFNNSKDDAEIEEPFEFYLLSLRSIAIVGVIERWCIACFWSWLSRISHKSEHIDSKGFSENHEIFFKRSLLFLFLVYLLPELFSSATLLGWKMASKLLLHDSHFIWMKCRVPLRANILFWTMIWAS